MVALSRIFMGFPLWFRRPAEPVSRTNRRNRARFRMQGRGPCGPLLDLGFLELDMLAHDGIVLAEGELLGLGARILLRDVEETRVRRADELDLDSGRLGHDPKPLNRSKRNSGAR